MTISWTSPSASRPAPPACGGRSARSSCWASASWHTGYNGAPRGAPCDETADCLRAELGIPRPAAQEICRGARRAERHHQAALHGVSVNGGTITSPQPCITCAKMIINAGIERVVCAETYPTSWRAASWLRRHWARPLVSRAEATRPAMRADPHPFQVCTAELCIHRRSWPPPAVNAPVDGYEELYGN